MLPAAAMERILKKAGAGRVGEDAKKALADVLTELALHIGEQAVKIAQNCGRKTVMDTDIKMVKLK